MAVVAVVVEKDAPVEQVNAILHEYCDYIIGRMGIPYHKRKIRLISVALDAPQEVISALSGRLGKLEGVNVRTAYSRS